MPNPTLKMDSVTVLDKDSDGVHFKNSIVHNTTNIKDAFSSLDSSASNGPTSGTAVTKSTTLPLFGCRAWVNFDGTSTTSISSEDCCAIRASGNVSKVVRNNTGRYTITFATAMPDANYAIQITVAGTGSYSDWSRTQYYVQSSVSTTSFQLHNVDETDSYYNSSSISVSVFR